jgi:hypothetical protein
LSAAESRRVTLGELVEQPRVALEGRQIVVVRHGACSMISTVACRARRALREVLALARRRASAASL